jgi:hypothetical protein
VQNLRDKLLKAGLVTADQAEKAAAEPSPTPANGGGPFLTARLQPLRAVPKLPPLAGSKASQRLEAKRQVERDRQLRERVLASQVSIEPGERAFYFVTRKNRLRRLELSAAQAELLEQGRLAIVERPDPAQIEHALIPAALAATLLAEFPKAVRFLSSPDAPVGFLSDDEVRARAAAEAAESPEERAAADAPQSAEQRAEEAVHASDAGLTSAPPQDGKPGDERAADLLTGADAMSSEQG